MSQQSAPKMVIVVRHDLNLRRGKLVAQTAHAVLKNILDLGSSKSDSEYVLHFKNKAVSEWIHGTFTKICVYVEGEQELLHVYYDARRSGIHGALILDAGLTEFHGVHTYTCCALGPDYPDVLDKFTGHLPLY